jgi:hypothetical protein
MQPRSAVKGAPNATSGKFLRRMVPFRPSLFGDLSQWSSTHTLELTNSALFFSTSNIDLQLNTKGKLDVQQ